MAEDSLRHAIDAIGRRLQEELEEQLSALTARHQEEVESARRTAEAEAEQRWEARLEAVRSEWAARLESEVDAARGEAERRMVAETMRVRVEAEQAAGEAATRLEQAHEQALNEERERAAARLTNERQALASARDHVQRELEQAHRQIEALKQEVDGLLTVRRNAEAAVEAARSAAGAEVEAARRDAAAEVEAARSAAAAEVDDARRAAAAALEEARHAAAAAVEQSHAERDALTSRLQEANAAHESARATHEDLTRRLTEATTAHHQLRATHDDLDRRLGDAAAAHEQTRAAHDDLARRLADAHAATESARVAERQARLVIVERLLTAVRDMDAARSLSDVLAALLAAAAREAPRVALFVVNGTELRGWKAEGFNADATSLHAGTTADEGLFGDVLRRGEPVVTADGAGPSAPSFAGLPKGRAAIAVPLLVGAQPVAVLYADDGAIDGAHESPATWPEAVQILGRHASVNLAHLTAARAADAMRRSLAPGGGAPRKAAAPAPEDGDSARRYAKLLVSEIKLYNEAAVRLGRQRRDLLARLRPEIDRARKLYEQRFSPAVDSRGALFHQELVQTLADGDPALLGGSA